MLFKLSETQLSAFDNVGKLRKMYGLWPPTTHLFPYVIHSVALYWAMVLM